ncbi:murein hydrolase activator EnvC family protein [Aerolutibacter ruishenii]|uniref:Septal ring factor EnvC (AmiA/AmiB activator) n=1 Tax=Aerolutibacter ruishenii TaxID=686800 RepID=A0A562LCI3_9GAMM|nr:peptidoglycan DD-metalloendopeptidase family protein [Lysobacter ruishenii]TWI05357.1 septal ring factor EnvC (AmiA/AmiB activator) [Lysobacter ruishenii]
MPTPRTALAGVLLALLGTAGAPAQDRNTTERKLETVKRELESVAAERRKLEGERGSASRQLREVDERVGQSARSLRETERRMGSDEASLLELQRQRDELQVRVAGHRDELAKLLRAAYVQGGAAPLKVMLAQDRVADASRVLVYHRYAQQDRAKRIAALTRELQALEAVERDVVQRRSSLESARAEQRQQLLVLEQDRKARATLVAELDSRYRDQRSREQALGRDAKGLEQLLRRLRAAAARAETQRKAAAAREARQARAGSGKTGGASTPRRATTVGSAPPPQVGGLGWPVAGALLAGFGATMPDGHRSDGLLIGAGAGSNVSAVADGGVVYAEWMTGYGLLLIVDHGNGYMSLYAHNDALLRDVGDRVRKGQPVATVGSSGGHGRPALYFELRRNGQPVNPGVWLRR